MVVSILQRQVMASCSVLVLASPTSSPTQPSSTHRMHVNYRSRRQPHRSRAIAPFRTPVSIHLQSETAISCRAVNPATEQALSKPTPSDPVPPPSAAIRSSPRTHIPSHHSQTTYAPRQSSSASTLGSTSKTPSAPRRHLDPRPRLDVAQPNGAAAQAASAHRGKWDKWEKGLGDWGLLWGCGVGLLTVPDRLSGGT